MYSISIVISNHLLLVVSLLIHTKAPLRAESQYPIQQNVNLFEVRFINKTKNIIKFFDYCTNL